MLPAREALTCIADGRLRVLCSIVLRHAGYRVREVATPAEARAAIEGGLVSLLVAGALAEAVPEEVRRWLRVPVDDQVVAGLADRVSGWLCTPAPVRARAREALGAVARERYSWEGVARGVLRAARGELGALPPVPCP
ncbi:MAG: hypothetical protein KY462_16955 [Actinobacteria bacterium]|nr:hypothetical protein [Actinomycetota bacterium]